MCASARLSLILTCLHVTISFFLQAEPAPLPTSKRLSLTPGKPSLSPRQLSRGRMLGGGSQRALDRLRNGLPSLQESLAAANRTGSPGNCIDSSTSCGMAIQPHSPHSPPPHVPPCHRGNCRLYNSSPQYWQACCVCVRWGWDGGVVGWGWRVRRVVSC